MPSSAQAFLVFRLGYECPQPQPLYCRVFPPLRNVSSEICKKEKWLPEEALQTAEKREATGKGERERYTQMNAEFQRNTTDKKAFFSEQCKEIEENNRMEKTRALFKKIGDTKGTFHAKMGTRKERNGKDLTKAKEMKRRWQEYIRELYKKVLMNQITTMVWSLT